jgi:hypothetical protein
VLHARSVARWIRNASTSQGAHRPRVSGGGNEQSAEARRRIPAQSVHFSGSIEGARAARSSSRTDCSFGRSVSISWLVLLV